MDALTIHEAAQTTGWSPRMLRYIERIGLIEPQRSDAGYRLFGPGELQRLRTLRELLAEHDLGLADVAVAQRLRREDGLRSRRRGMARRPSRSRPETVSADDWLRWEQQKHARLLAAATDPRAWRRPRDDDDHCGPQRDRLQGRRPLPRRLRPQGDPARRARDARPDADRARSSPTRSRSRARASPARCT